MISATDILSCLVVIFRSLDLLDETPTTFSCPSPHCGPCAGPVAYSGCHLEKTWRARWSLGCVNKTDPPAQIRARLALGGEQSTSKVEQHLCGAKLFLREQQQRPACIISLLNFRLVNTEPRDRDPSTFSSPNTEYLSLSAVQSPTNIKFEHRSISQFKFYTRFRTRLTQTSPLNIIHQSFIQWLAEKENRLEERALVARPQLLRAPRSSRATLPAPVSRYVAVIMMHRFL